MALLGRTITVLGVLAILAPIVAGVLSLVDVTIPVVLAYAPTFILGGIVLFIVGIALQNFGR